jgi:hypothetical protein
MDLTAGKMFDRVTGTWLDPDEYERRKADYEERAFQRRASQGDLCAPRILRDDMGKHVQSMTNGRYYDSKSELRKEYRRAGVIEVGNDVPMKRPAPSRDERERAKKERKAAVGRALSRAGFGAP